MYACARIGAIHSVVFGGFAAKELATRIDDCQAEADPLGLAAASRARASCPTSRCSTRRSISRKHKPAGLPHPAAPAMRSRADAGPRPRLGDAARRGARGEQDRALRAGARDRSALHPLHLGHDRHPEGRGARQWRPHGRARNGRCKNLYGVEARRGVLGGLRHRLGGRPLLHRLCAAVSRLHHDPLRGQAGRHAGRRRVLARHRRAQGVALFTAPTAFRAIKKEDPQGKLFAQYDLSKFRTLFLAGERADPPTDRMGRAAAESAGDRSLVADRNRLGDRRQSDGARHAAGQARLADRARCRATTCASSTRQCKEVPAGKMGSIVVKLPLPPVVPADAVAAGRALPRKLSRRISRLLQDRRRRLQGRGRLPLHHGPHRRHHQCRGPPALDRRHGGGARAATRTSPNAP